MPLQLLRKTASAFTPDIGSNISLDGDHLKCDDFLVSSGYVSRQIYSSALLNDGRYICTTKFPQYIFIYSLDMSSVSANPLSDSDATQKAAMCVDNSDNVYLANWTNPGSIKKYNNDGTFIWEYAGAGSTLGAYSWPCGLRYHNGLIYSVNKMYHYVFIINEDGNFVNEINITAGGSGLTRPRDVWITNNYIYIVCNYGAIGIWDVNTLNYIGRLGTVPYGNSGAADVAIYVLINGDWIVGDGMGAQQYGGISYSILDGTDFTEKRKLGFRTTNYAADALKGGLYFSEYGFSNVVIDEINKYLYIGAYRSQGSGENTCVIKMDIRDASERFATLQHDFGMPANIQRLFVNDLPNNTDESWKSMRLWYQIDAGGWNEVDLKNPLLNINGQNLELKLGMTSYGFRNWPKFYSIDILYETQESAPDVGERSFDILDVSTELEVMEL